MSYDLGGDGLQRFYLVDKWVLFLRGYEWQLYCHLTFPSCSSEHTAERSFAVWIHDLNRKEFGHRYWKRDGVGLTWARGSERQERGDVHFHAVIGNCRRITPEIAIARWKKITEGNAKIELFNASKNGIEYIVKHCKPGYGNIEVSKSLRDQLPQ